MSSLESMNVYVEFAINSKTYKFYDIVNQVIRDWRR